MVLDSLSLICSHPGAQDRPSAVHTQKVTIAPACADRNGEPPKPGAAYESQPDGAAGGPLRPDRALKGPWRPRGVPRGSEHQSCTNTRQSRDPLDDYMLRAALEGTHPFLVVNEHAHQMIYSLILL